MARAITCAKYKIGSTLNLDREKWRILKVYPFMVYCRSIMYGTYKYFNVGDLVMAGYEPIYPNNIIPEEFHDRVWKW